MLWLEAEGKKFAGLYVETEHQLAKGTVMILHDQGGYPNQLQLIKTLRTQLPMHDWSTLALQMPVREMLARTDDYYDLFPEAKARIEAGIRYLQSNQVDSIVMVGYGLGASMMLYSLAEKNTAVKALVAVSLSVPETNHPATQVLEQIKKIQVPLLDLFAVNDLPNVITTARNRRLAAIANPAYRQAVIHEENHLFSHDEALAVKRIYSWIERTMGSLAPAAGSNEGISKP
jgi:pimeloyl-ACP methyl ester carboxylesterase